MRIMGKGINLLKLRTILRKRKFPPDYELYNRKLMDGSGGPVMIHNNKVILYVNSAFAAMMEGFSPEAYTDKELSEVFAEPDLTTPSYYAAGQTIMYGNQGTVEAEIIRLPTVFRGQLAQLVLFSDTLCKRKTEEELRSVKDMLHSFIENTNDGIVIVDRDGHVLRVNQAFEKLHGWKQEELVGKNMPMVPSFLLEEAKQIQNKVSSGETVSDFETYKLKKDGSIFPVSVTVSPLKDQAGNVTGFVGVERDITERRMAEEALRLAQEEMATTVREQQGVIFKYKRVDNKFVLTLCEGELLYKFGLTPEQIVGKELFEIYPREYAADILVYYDKAMNQGENVSFEDTFNGITYLCSLRPIVKDGSVVEVVGSSIEITERKEMELALKESEERYRLLVELSPEPIIVYGEDYKVLFVNGAAVKLLAAAEAGELLGRTVMQMIHPESADSFLRAMEYLLSEGSPTNTIEKRLVRLDGRIIEIEARGVPITYSGKKAVQFLCKDVTDRKIAEETIRESDRRYQMLLKLSPEPVVAHDGDILIYANDAAVKLVGASSYEELIGKPMLDFIHPEHQGAYVERMKQVRETDAQMSFSQAKIITLNNEIIEVEGSSIYVYKHLNVPIIQTVFRDITERKRTEEMIIRSEKLSIVGQLAAGVAHEIRNPLTTLKGFTQLIKAGKINDVYIDLMQIELERINQIVSEFMVIAKPQNVVLQKHDLYKIIVDFVQFMKMQAIINKVEIRYNLKEKVICTCNLDQLKQVFINILKNAIEAMPDGGNIDIRMTCTEERIRIRFKDEGIGIPQEILSRLGEPFFTTKETGTGLGLMICHKIIEAHNGSMQIFSELNSGTVIEIELPNK